MILIMLYVILLLVAQSLVALLHDNDPVRAICYVLWAILAAIIWHRFELTKKDK